MTALADRIEVTPSVYDVQVTDDTLTVELDDGRTVSVPIAWYPRLLNATMEEKKKWRLIGNGHGIHWEAIDEDISVDGILSGRPSGESQSTIKKWLESRKNSDENN